jgi:hypothetical protein
MRIIGSTITFGTEGPMVQVIRPPALQAPAMTRGREHMETYSEQFAELKARADGIAASLAADTRAALDVASENGRRAAKGLPPLSVLEAHEIKRATREAATFDESERRREILAERARSNATRAAFDRGRRVREQADRGRVRS